MKKFYLFCLLVPVLSVSYAQDPVFFSTNQSLIYLNPSFAGSNGNIRNQLTHRNQWPMLGGSFKTSVNSFDAYLSSLKAGIAVTAFYDDLMHGTLKTSAVSLAYSQYLSLMDGQLKIIPAVQFTYGQRNLDVSNLHFGDMIDPRYGTVWSSRTHLPSNFKDYFDFSSGLLVNYKNKLYVGGSLFHINQPDIGLSGVLKMPHAINFHASYYLTLTEQSRLQFFYRGLSQQKFTTHLMAINMISYNHLVTGLGISVGDVVFINAGYRSNYFSLVAGYDMTISKLAGNSLGSWELSASFNLRNKEHRKTLTTFETW